MLISILRKLSAPALAATLSLTAHAVTIDFEDASGPFLDIYQGFSWSGGAGSNSWVVAEEGGGLDIGFNSAHSGTHYVWSNGGTYLTMAGGIFDFNSVWAQGGHGSSDLLTARGYLAGSEIYNHTQNLSGYTYQNILLNFVGVDTVRFDYVSNLVLDDIVVNGSSVPDRGSSLSLVAFGLLAVASLRRKMRRN